MMLSTYLVLPLSIFLILLYFTSLMLVRLGIIRNDVSRKIWNTLLLLTFLVTAILGLLIAVQVSYKIEWSFVESLLKWHVNFGIAMSFVAIFHLFWHFRYYLNLFIDDKKDNSTLPQSTNPELSRTKLKSLVLLTGFASIIVQVLLIRESTTVFESNELMIGWTLGIWMLLTGAGAFFGRNSKPQNTNRLIVYMLLFICLLPLVIVFILSALKAQLFPPGILLNPLYFIVMVSVLLSPLCLVIGYSFAIFLKANGCGGDNFSLIYAIESIGSLFGGLVVSFLMIGWLTICQSLLVLDSFIFLCLLVIVKRYNLAGFFLLSLLILILSFAYPIDRWIRSMQYPNQNIVEIKETRFGNLTVTETIGQYNFFVNGSLFFTTDNVVENEEHVHYAMLQHKNPKRVLLISGGISGMLDEVLKYPSVNLVDYVELNPDIIKIGYKYRQIPKGSKVMVHNSDSRRFITKTNNTYDVVIFAIPDPTSIQINRLYTIEFIRSVKLKLNRNAVIIYSLSSSGNYISNAKANIVAAVYNTLKKNFSNVEIIPGERDYFVASDAVITPGISELSIMREIKNKYVNPYYIDDYSSKRRGEFIKEAIASNSIINTDNKPVPLFYEFQLFLAQHSSITFLWVLIPLVVLIIPFLFLKNISKSVYVAGFSSSSVELLIIFLFQLTFGYIYSAIGVIIAVFMAGLAVGSIVGKRTPAYDKYLFLSQVALGVSILFFPFIFQLVDLRSNSFIAYAIIILITLIPSSIVGFIYVIGTKLLQLNHENSATVNYSADLIGSAFGIIAITVILMPVLGFSQSCYVIASINFTIAVLTLFTNRNIFISTK